jgi:hypothetical protein
VGTHGGDGSFGGPDFRGAIFHAPEAGAGDIGESERGAHHATGYFRGGHAALEETHAREQFGEELGAFGAGGGLAHKRMRRAGAALGGKPSSPARRCKANRSGVGMREARGLRWRGVAAWRFVAAWRLARVGEA